MRSFIITFANNSSLKLVETKNHVISSCGISYPKYSNEINAVARIANWVSLELNTFYVCCYEI